MIIICLLNDRSIFHRVMNMFPSLNVYGVNNINVELVYGN